jgi:DNA helicase-2/ATP-dependent DNA helicase PcrA
VPTATLNPQQRAAAEHPPEAGPLLVVAGAGTGKTMTLAARLAWLVHERRADPQRILLITFSRRAAAEMAHRAGLMLHAALGLRPGAPVPQLPWCGTFHGIAARLLRDEAAHVGLPAGFTVLDRADAQDLLGLVRQRLGMAEVATGQARFPTATTCQSILSRCINTRTPLPVVLSAHYPWCSGARVQLEALFDAFADTKRAQHSLDFDDLLLAWWHLMARDAVRAERIRERFDHVLVDEVQDINRLQSELLLALRPGGGGLTAVGDDAQSIYAFRGADVRHILDFPKAFTPPARVLPLEENYRSTQPILDASHAVIEQVGERFAKRLWSRRGPAPKPRLLVVDDEAAQARSVTDEVLRAREQGLKLMQQAVLFRTGTHSLALEFELTRRNVPFVKYGGLQFLESAHLKDVLAVLRWADNPCGELAGLRAARLVAGLGPASVRRCLDAARTGQPFTPPPAAREGWLELATLLALLRGGTLGWPQELAAVLDWYRPALERIHARDATVRWAELQQLLQLASATRGRHAFVTELTLDPPAASGDHAGEPHLDEDYLILSTIHSAKGQEWNAVHVLNVVDGCMPADVAAGSAAELDEERRLLYVAMTRARDALTLWVPQRFHVTQQRALGGRHLYAPRSRFVTDAVLACLDTDAPAPAPEAPPPEATPAAVPATAPDAAAASALHTTLRRAWAG